MPNSFHLFLLKHHIVFQNGGIPHDTHKSFCYSRKFLSHNRSKNQIDIYLPCAAPFSLKQISRQLYTSLKQNKIRYTTLNIILALKIVSVKHQNLWNQFNDALAYCQGLTISWHVNVTTDMAAYLI